jgi:glycosyltransferase involved in cell wall biosynthesis
VKIVILSPFHPYRGGIAQFSERLYKELVKDHNVLAVSFSLLYPGILFPGKSQYTGQHSDFNSERILNSINPFTYEKTVRTIERFAPDVLIIAYWMPFFAPAYTYIAFRMRKKTRIIALVHNVIPHEFTLIARPLARMFFSLCDSFVVMSEAVERDLVQLHPSADIRMLPHPLYDHFGAPINRLQARSELNIGSDMKTMLFFGLIRDYKGLDILIEAMSLLDDTHYLIIAGEPYGDFGKYRRLIDSSPARERIQVIARYVNDTEIPALFSAADVLVAPYRSATQSGVIPVACHFHLPVVATDVGGLGETIRRAAVGMVCKPNAVSVAEFINRFFSSDRSLYWGNFLKLKQELSWERFTGQILTDGEGI